MSSTVSATTSSSIPAQPTGQQQTRWVPAFVGPAEHPMQIQIECPQWCLTDHSERECALADITHCGDCSAVVQVASLLNADAHSELLGAIALDPSSPDPRLRAAHIVIASGGGPDAYLDPAMAEQLANDLDVFAQQLRRQARTVRAHNEAQA